MFKYLCHLKCVYVGNKTGDWIYFSREWLSTTLAHSFNMGSMPLGRDSSLSTN